MFYFENILEKETQVRYVFVENISDRTELIQLYIDKLDFPYQDLNWDAFNDVIVELEWIPELVICIIHKNIPKMDQKDIISYLRILYLACMTWNKYPTDHVFKVFFDPIDKKYVEQMLSLSA